MKKKVFFIMSTDDYSGAEAVNFSIIENLNKKYDFYWVSKKGNINNFLEEKNIKWIEIKKLSIKEIKRIIKENTPDILHTTDYRASVICSITNTKIPIISHLHNNAPWIKKLNINSLSFLIASKNINKILTVSNSIQKEYIFYKHIKNKTENINNPVNRENILSKVKDEYYQKKYDICCTARLAPPKNPKKFIEIIYELKKTNPNIKAIWIGSGDLLDSCHKLVKELKLTKNIKFIGFKKNPYKYMASSKLFMLTSDWEGYGLVAFEALTLGLPCITSKVGGLTDIVDDECGKLCTQKEEYINFINDILQDDKKYKTYSKRAVSKSKKLDNSKTYFKKIDEIYRKAK